MKLTRRTFLASASALALTRANPVLAAASEPTPFSRETVIVLAQELAAKPYRARDMVPEAWINLTYEQYKLIRFLPEASLWRGTETPYNVDFFTPGLYFPRTVKVDVVEAGMAQRLPFDMAMFEQSDSVPDLPVDETLGFSGLRLRTEMHRPGETDEFCVWQGASYFRAIGLDQAYGLSARGLALRTGDPEGEEFPEFIRFWLERPLPGQRNMIVHALMDSPSVAGAYRFDVTPGETCVIDVQATLFAREDMPHVGIAPLTSMFLYDDTNRTRFDDFRPAVYDSDGLLVENGAGEILWRPLANPHHLQVSSFSDDNPRGFGLMQRAKYFHDFSDLEAHYHRRPSLWIEPMGNWGRGAVTLVEIPADQEIYDNIVAYWRPELPVPAGQRTDMAYRMHWGPGAPIGAALAKVFNTAMGARRDGSRQVIIDFEDHPGLNVDHALLEAKVASDQAAIDHVVLQRNPETGGLRLAFTFAAGESEWAELRAEVRKEGQPATEIWLYRWTK